MKIAIDSTKTGWEQVTDIPCVVAGCPGLLRWAEAGYVPGYRICDCCGSHYSQNLRSIFSPSGAFDGWWDVEALREAMAAGWRVLA